VQKCIRLIHDDFKPKINRLFGFETGAFAWDVFGGVFCLHNTVHYFAPDLLEFEDLQIARDSWDEWVETEQADTFYQSWYWDNIDAEIIKLQPYEGFLIYPPLWAKECDISTAKKTTNNLLCVVWASLELRRTIKGF
jgi:hypothetical protein